MMVRFAAWRSEGPWHQMGVNLNESETDSRFGGGGRAAARSEL